MSTPAIIYIVLAAVSLLLNAAEHGKPKKGVHSFWTSFVAFCIVVPLLYWGGFFNMVHG